MKLIRTFGVLALLGVASSASAIVLTGGPTYTPPNGGSCSLAGNAKLTGGATWTCSPPAAGSYTNLYIGIKNDNVPSGTSPQGESMDSNQPTGAEIFAHSSTGATTIVYTGTTSIWTGSAYSTAYTRLTLTFSGTGAMVTDATTIALSNANGAVHSLWRTTVTSPSTFTVNALIEASDAAGGPWTPADLYFGTTTVHGKNTRSGTDSDISHVDIGFYYSSCGDGVLDGSEQCDLGGANGSSTSCCTSTCTYRAAGQTCRTSTGECDPAETCTGSSGTCPANSFTAAGTPCTDTSPPGSNDPNQCKDAQCNGSGACSQTFANEVNGTACADGNYCTTGDTCQTGTCTAGGGNPCPGPDGDGDCSETCVDTGFETGNCDGNDPAASACNDGLFCTATDTCNGSGTCTGTGDPCPGPDGDGDCSESCNEATDNCTANDPDASVCTDGQFCTGTETCTSGTCGSSTGDPCPGPDGDGDCSESCNEAGDDCTANDPAASACDDGLFCTVTDTCNGSGTCGGTGDPCPGPDGDGDCSESCNEAGDDCTTNDPAASACNDGLFCTVTDTCNGSGTCTGTGDPCPGPDGDGDCSESCNEAGNDCTANDPAASACNDGLFCTATDTCNGSGTCTGTGDPCPGPDGDSDCSESCNEAADNCTAADPNGSACTDNLFCTGTETCTSGTCGSSTGDPCPGPDGDTNCSESCNEAADNCLGADSDGTLCRADAGECDVAETCSSGACPANGFEASGFPCGDPTDNDCNDPDTCDGLGACQPNYELPTVVCRAATTGGACDEVENCDGAGNCPADGFKPSTEVCRPDAGECDVAENCTGTSPFCPSDAFEPPTTACGSSLDDDCTNPDTCSGTSNTCLAHDEANGFACGDPNNTECNKADTCNGAGTCLANNEPSGTACGDPSNTDCTDPDACDGNGTCLGNNESAGSPCGDPSATDCTNPDTCDGSGTCLEHNFAVGTACGDSNTTACTDPDTCNGSGTCLTNDQPAGTSCPDDGNLCTVDQCNGSGTCGHPAGNASVVCRPAASDCDEVEACDGTNPACPADSPKAAGTSCRTATGECDAAETCDGSSFVCPADGVKAAGTTCTSDGNICTLDECDGVSTLCQHPAGNAGTTCRPAAGDCDVAETCDGSSPTCPTDGFEAAGAACGSSANTDCTDPDTCNGAGVCLANNAPNGTPCEDGNVCTTGETCTNGTCAGGSGTCPLDHYKCYQGKDLKNPKFTKTTATTTDQIITNEAVELQKVKFVCTPVDKNGEGINDPNAHLTCYQIKASNLSVRPNLEVSTQFQSSKFQAKKGKLLCVPSSKTIIP